MLAILLWSTRIRLRFVRGESTDLPYDEKKIASGDTDTVLRDLGDLERELTRSLEGLLQGMETKLL